MVGKGSGSVQRYTSNAAEWDWGNDRVAGQNGRVSDIYLAGESPAIDTILQVCKRLRHFLEGRQDTKKLA